jgi:hypothetical protein
LRLSYRNIIFCCVNLDARLNRTETDYFMVRENGSFSNVMVIGVIRITRSKYIYMYRAYTKEWWRVYILH